MMWDFEVYVIESNSMMWDFEIYVIESSFYMGLDFS